uniref:Uncharacterized protein n=1 Tax=viral metagenome TaxID=1070528 RepID=A0A6M3LIQ8_9ZZZZ
MGDKTKLIDAIIENLKGEIKIKKDQLKPYELFLNVLEGKKCKACGLVEEECLCLKGKGKDDKFNKVNTLSSS